MSGNPSPIKSALAPAERAKSDKSGGNAAITQSTSQRLPDINWRKASLKMITRSAPQQGK
jgi:hypothetical protein